MKADILSNNDEKSSGKKQEPKRTNGEKSARFVVANSLNEYGWTQSELRRMVGVRSDE